MNLRHRAMALLVGYILGLASVGLILRFGPTRHQVEVDMIGQLLRDQESAWNRGDLEAFMRGYWNSPELTFRSGDKVVRGYEQTLERYRKRYQQDGAEMGQLTFSDLEIELLSHHEAFATGRWQLRRSKDEPSGLFTLRLRKFPDVGWRIVSDHTSSRE